MLQTCILSLSSVGLVSTHRQNQDGGHTPIDNFRAHSEGQSEMYRGGIRKCSTDYVADVNAKEQRTLIGLTRKTLASSVPAFDISTKANVTKLLII